MRFTVVNRHWNPRPGSSGEAFLERDAWDDFGFRTQFRLWMTDNSGTLREIGTIKIAELDASRQSHIAITQLPERFEALDSDFFSLGQDDTYYDNLRGLGDHLRIDTLTSLRDVAYDLDLFNLVRYEEVTQTSLLRFVDSNTVIKQYHRIATGGARLSAFKISYKEPVDVDLDLPHKALELPFDVNPESLPPTNIHVLTGRNGVGKSALLRQITQCVVDNIAPIEMVGEIVDHSGGSTRTFSNLVTVAFSAFDNFTSIPTEHHAVPYYYVGLAKDPHDPMPDRILKDHLELAEDFAEGLEACLTGAAARRWSDILNTLSYSGSGFPDISWLNEFEAGDGVSRRSSAHEFFGNLSSGHKIVLLTMTRLVQYVNERSLVLIDEPESHLHPPLLAAFIRALSDLLADRNGVAIIATHSPVVLQEVPAHCVWKLRRNGGFLYADRPTTETFGENVGILTHEVFALEVTDSGFHREIKRAVDRGYSYEEVLAMFNGHLGSEARAIVRTLIAVRERRHG